MRLFPSSALLTSAGCLLFLVQLVSSAADIGQPREPAEQPGPKPEAPEQAQVAGFRCSARSLRLARQVLAQQLHQIDQYNSVWFNDLDLEEIRDGQKQSLANMILMSTFAQQKQELLLAEHKSNPPLVEIEASGFRHLSQASSLAGLKLQPLVEAINSAGSSHKFQAISLRLLESSADGWDARHRCSQLNGSFVYTFRLSLGPLEHNMDVVYNLPKELRISQPIDWRYAQIKLIVPVMVYEISLKQAIDYKLASSRCPMELADVTYLGSSLSANSRGQLGAPKQAQVAILAAGMAATNQTISQLERLFDDYTRPSISRRLRQVLKFHLSSKTLPLRPEEE